MMQFYIPEVVAVEQIDDEGDKLSDKVFKEFEQLKTKEKKEWIVHSWIKHIDVYVVYF